MLINKTNLAEIKNLIYEIHDRWFSVDQVIFDEDKHEFRLYFGAKKNLYNQCLKITGAVSCQIKDTEKVGVYDINYLAIDMKKEIIFIVGCIPIQIILKVTPDFEIIVGSN